MTVLLNNNPQRREQSKIEPIYFIAYTANNVLLIGTTTTQSAINHEYKIDLQTTLINIKPIYLTSFRMIKYKIIIKTS